MASGRKCVRILLVGDDNVGKTSMVVALATEETPFEVPDVAHELYITAEVTSQNVPALIVDTSNKVHSEDELRMEIEKADVVCVVYSLVDPSSRSSVISHWLPLIHESLDLAYKPVVVVANKCDLAANNIDPQDDEMNFINKEFKCVEGYFRVSAFTLEFLIEMFQFSQKVVLFPKSPLIDVDTLELTPALHQALHRIFRIFDSDADGVISSHEMLDFQRVVFKNLLHRQTLKEVRERIESYIPDGVTENGFTLAGFVLVHHLFLMSGMRDSVWRVLSTFGYSKELSFDDNYLRPEFEVVQGEYMELSPSALQFLKSIFYTYDKDNDGSLNRQEFEDVFAFHPTFPFSESEIEFCCTDENMNITLEGFLSLFVYKTNESYEWALSCLAILGFNKGVWDGNLDALQNVPSTSQSGDGFPTRNTYTCYVIGPPMCGKSTFLRRLLRQPVKEFAAKDAHPLVVTRALDSLSTDKFIIFREVNWFQTSQFVSSGQGDLFIFLYDTTDYNSFRAVMAFHKDLERVPSFIAGTKSDSTVVAQKCDVNPEDYCANHCSIPLMTFSSLNDDSGPLEYILDNFSSRLINGQAPTKKASSAFPELLTVISAFGIVVIIFTFMGRNGNSVKT